MRREGAHLIFQRRECADMMDTGLLIQSRDRLGARDFAARGVHWLVGDTRIDRAQRGFNHLAAIIGFGHDAIGIVRAERRDCARRPFMWTMPAGEIVQDITMAIFAKTRDDDAGLVGALARAYGGID